MPERRFDDGYWDDPFIQALSKDGKLLYAYLWTNKHCNPAGLYQITPSTIAFETKLAEADILGLFEELRPKAEWYPEENLVWVKNFIKRQSISSKFLVAVARSLTQINNHEAIKKLLEYNLTRYEISIPYPYPIDRVSIPSTSTSTSISKSKSNKGGGEEADAELARIAELYERDIGMITPGIAEQLKDIWATCPEPAKWFEAALKEALLNNKRSLKYIIAILERWKVEGFQTGRKTKAAGHVPTDEEITAQEKERGIS